jgi:hypothetical protein
MVICFSRKFAEIKQGLLFVLR